MKKQRDAVVKAKPPAEYKPPRVTPAFHAMVRDVIDMIAQEHMPPLQAIDVLGLSVEGLAKQVFSAYLPEGPPSHDQLLFAIQSSLLTVLRVHPELSKQAGICPDLGDSAIPKEFDAALEKFLRWGNTMLNPLVQDFLCLPRELDIAKREDMIVHQWGSILESAAIRVDRERLRSSLHDVLGVTIGEKSSEEEVFRNEEFLWWLTLLNRNTTKHRSIVRRAESEWVLDVEEARATAKQLIGMGKRQPEKVTASLDHYVDGTDSPLAQVTEQTSEAPPEDEFAHGELRDVRDALDAHRLLQEAVDAAYDRGAFGAGDLSDSLTSLATVLHRLRDPALQAAVVFTWSRGGRAAAHGGWTKHHVALEYGVTARQIEGQMERARTLLGTTRCSA